MARHFFETLNYTLGNEDAAVEFAVMPQKTPHVYAVAGSGSRVVPLMAKNPARVTCVDTSVAQLSLAELRVALVRSVPHEKYLSFWEYPSHTMSKVERKNIFESLVLSDRARTTCHDLFEKNGWSSLLYAGKWERTFYVISRVNRLFTGNSGRGVFSCTSLEEQKKYMETVFPHKRWSFVVRLLGNASVFNALLYGGSFPKKNIPGSFHSFYMKRFEQIFNKQIVRKNFFMQLLFFGKLQYSECAFLECDPDVYAEAKRHSNDLAIEYILGDIVESMKMVNEQVSFVSMSDTPSYFVPPTEQRFLQMMDDRLTSDAIIVCRYYLRVPENLDTGGYIDVTDHFRKDTMKEKVNMYTFGIYQKD